MGIKEIAKERIEKLFKLAEKTPNYAKRYIEIALKIQQKARIRLTSEQKKKYCKKCYSLIGKKDIVEKKRFVEISCPSCGYEFKRKN